MHFNDACYDSALMTFDLGHVPQQGNPLLQTTVSPADLFVTQPSHVATQSYAIPHINVASPDYSFVGYGMVDNTPQGVAWCHPLTQVVQSASHTSGQSSITNDAPAGHFTGLPMPIGRASRGSSRTCEWVSGDWLCGRTITERTIPKHLAEHGICGMHKDHIVQCYWRECGAHIKRQGILRHVREVHMGLKRKSHRRALLGAIIATDVF